MPRVFVATDERRDTHRELLDLLAGRRPEPVHLFATELVVRTSTGHPTVGRR